MSSIDSERGEEYESGMLSFSYIELDNDLSSARSSFASWVALHCLNVHTLGIYTIRAPTIYPPGRPLLLDLVSDWWHLNEREACDSRVNFEHQHVLIVAGVVYNYSLIYVTRTSYAFLCSRAARVNRSVFQWVTDRRKTRTVTLWNIMSATRANSAKLGWIEWRK